MHILYMFKKKVKSLKLRSLRCYEAGSFAHWPRNLSGCTLVKWVQEGMWHFLLSAPSFVAKVEGISQHLNPSLIHGKRTLWMLKISGEPLWCYRSCRSGSLDLVYLVLPYLVSFHHLSTTTCPCPLENQCSVSAERWKPEGATPHLHLQLLLLVL